MDGQARPVPIATPAIGARAALVSAPLSLAIVERRAYIVLQPQHALEVHPNLVKDTAPVRKDMTGTASALVLPAMTDRSARCVLLMLPCCSAMHVFWAMVTSYAIFLLCGWFTAQSSLASS